METKLLKQLRKEAKNKFKIGKINDKYTVFCLEEHLYDPVYLPDYGGMRYHSIEQAKSMCIYYRRLYILDEVEKCRKREKGTMVKLLDF